MTRPWSEKSGKTDRNRFQPGPPPNDDLAAIVAGALIGAILIAAAMSAHWLLS